MSEPTETTNNFKPEFNQLLDTAHASLVEVDSFDVDSSSAASLAKFNALRRQQAEAALKLIVFIQRNGADLLDAFDAELASETSEG
jgi:hypothetical protein